MSRKMLAAIALAIVMTGPSLWAQPPAGTVVPGSFICQVDDAADALTIGRAAAAATRGTLGHVYSHALNGFSIQVPPGIVVANLRAQRGVIQAEPDLVMHTCAQTLPTGVDRIDAEGAGGSIDVDIAIIDTGCGPHQDLDIVGGRRFYSKGVKSYSDDNYADDNGHGTHCAGIAAAIDDDFGVVGVAPGARIWAVKVLGANGSGRLSDIIAGIDWVTANANTIEVANMSLGGTGVSSAYQTAIRNSVNAGVVYVVAAGNASTDVYGADGVFGTSDDYVPAAYPEVMTISAMADSDGKPGGLGDATSRGLDDSFATFSNYSHSVVGNPVSSPGAAIDLILPGVNIYSTLPNDSYAIYSGTSMASPHGAGLVARYIAANDRATDDDGVYAIRQALINAAKAQDDSAYGLVNGGDPDSKLERIGWAGSSVNSPPRAGFTYSASGLTVTFADTSTDSDGTVTAWSWSFGDGATSEQQYPSHSYAEAGKYTVTLEVTDDDGATDSASHEITVSEPTGNIPPVAGFTYTVSGLTVTFTDTSTDSDGTVTAWIWDFGDGTTSTEQNPSRSYTAAGEYSVKLTVTDDGGAESSVSQSITVTAPVTDATLSASLSPMTFTYRKAGANYFVTASVFVQLVDDANGGNVALQGATVAAEWSPGGMTTGVTNDSGQVTLMSSEVKTRSPLTFTLTVRDIEASGYTYEDDDPSVSGTWQLPGASFFGF
ncbi:MAG: S8 family serine peptidase [Phycisphaerae bacterium]|nr:S8 family serine peptidase [Phycisphaerae bacterium]